MPTISLNLPVSGTVITAGLHVSNYTAIQTLLNGGLDANNLADGAVTGAKIAGYPSDSAKILRGDGTWGTQEVAYNNLSGTVGPTAVTVLTSGGDLLLNFPSATYLATKYYFELWIASLVASAAGPNHHYFALYDGAANQSGWMAVSNVTTTAAGPWFFKVPFTPTAGTKALSVKWGSNGGGHNLTISALIGGAGTVQARIFRA